jgi:transcriptional regulator with XRE-family HTH domain
MEVSSQFFEKVKHIRNKKGYSQGDIANHLNITQSAYSRIECCISEPTLKQVYQIAEALETPIHKLLPNTNYINQQNDNFSQCTVIGTIENMHLSSAIGKMEELSTQIADFIKNVKK